MREHCSINNFGKQTLAVGNKYNVGGKKEHTLCGQIDLS